MATAPGPSKSAEAKPAAAGERLSRSEDDELRRLHFLSQLGALSERSKVRLLELRLRDRRREIRTPREFGNSN